MRLLVLSTVAALAACDPSDPPEVPRFVEAEIRLLADRPENGCFAAVEDRGWIETPCASVMTEEFPTSLQRALIARGLMESPASGTFDEMTGEAVRAFQAPLGLDSATLSLAAAKRLGLVPYERSELGGG